MLAQLVAATLVFVLGTAGLLCWCLQPAELFPDARASPSVVPGRTELHPQPSSNKNGSRCQSSTMPHHNICLGCHSDSPYTWKITFQWGVCKESEALGEAVTSPHIFHLPYEFIFIPISSVVWEKKAQSSLSCCSSSLLQGPLLLFTNSVYYLV